MGRWEKEKKGAIKREWKSKKEKQIESKKILLKMKSLCQDPKSNHVKTNRKETRF